MLTFEKKFDFFLLFLIVNNKKKQKKQQFSNMSKSNMIQKKVIYKKGQSNIYIKKLEREIKKEKLGRFHKKRKNKKNQKMKKEDRRLKIVNKTYYEPGTKSKPKVEKVEEKEIQDFLNSEKYVSRSFNPREFSILLNMVDNMNLNLAPKKLKRSVADESTWRMTHGNSCSC